MPATTVTFGQKSLIRTHSNSLCRKEYSIRKLQCLSVVISLKRAAATRQWISTAVSVERIRTRRRFFVRAGCRCRADSRKRKIPVRHETLCSVSNRSRYSVKLTIRMHRYNMKQCFLCGTGAVFYFLSCTTGCVCHYF